MHWHKTGKYIVIISFVCLFIHVNKWETVHGSWVIFSHKLGSTSDWILLENEFGLKLHHVFMDFRTTFCSKTQELLFALKPSFHIRWGSDCGLVHPKDFFQEFLANTCIPGGGGCVMLPQAPLTSS